MRRKILSIVAERQMAYKTSLTNNSVFGAKSGEFSGLKNPTIDQETCHAFVESRMTPEFLGSYNYMNCHFRSVVQIIFYP